MVVVSDPAAVRAVFTAPVDVAIRAARARLPRAVRRPELDPRARRPRAPAPAQADAAAVPRRPHARAPRPDRRARGGRGRALAARASRSPPTARMQALTLDVIMRVVFGAELPELRTAIRRTLDMTMSLPRMLFFSLTGNDLGFRRALDCGRGAADRGHPRAPGGRAAATAILDELIAAAPPTTSCATSSSRCSPPATRRRRARCVGARAARAPPRGARAAARRRAGLRRRRRQGGAAHAARPDDRRAQARRAVLASPAGSCPRACTSRPASTSRTAAPSSTPDPTAFRPERFLGDGAPDSYAWIPFGGGDAPLRRRGVRRDGDDRGAARGRRARDAAHPTARRGERMRRRSVTLTPERRGRA